MARVRDGAFISQLGTSSISKSRYCDIAHMEMTGKALDSDEGLGDAAYDTPEGDSACAGFW